MKKIFTTIFCLFLFCSVFAQSGVDTLHYRKVYYFGGTGMGFPMGKTKTVLSPKFSGSLGLDISLKNPKYYVYPALYTLSFDYKQKTQDPQYAYKLEDANANFYIFSLAGGIRKQLKRLNTYAYAGPGMGLMMEPRAHVDAATSIVNIKNENKLSFSGKLGIGADYRFNGFFLGVEVGYLHSFNKIQETPINIMTVMVGLKSDITRLGDKVVKVIGVEGSISGKEQK
ncbi:hypothetical protein LZQ00_04495 [Sphingobacterium sp. SRCM116780]|uniref:hypothetical protein n=1 Tax=Sphingobacterium sp. SRCM116780 TaxID=2907623 RepID=UPI001F2D8E2F|nr:hypothetical protein [Sphingobacterium sp. SRCM116780]UIR57076.1 hypothetical protein LZQ00_04495 [Sphingobacterium sp. SRCM116780]